MSSIRIAREYVAVFVLLDTDANEVIGLGNAFSVALSKNGGAFGAGVGTKAEIGSGWYSYELTAQETDTAGPLAIKVTGAGIVQQNLLYTVSGSVWAPGAGPSLLTTTEAAAVLRCEDDDPAMLSLLPMVDAYIVNATGRDWTQDAAIDPRAVSAARILLVEWFENPAMISSGFTSLDHGLAAVLTQLEAEALKYRKYEFAGRVVSGSIHLKGAAIGDDVIKLLGVAGVSGSQTADFEAEITVKDHIQQSADEDLSANRYAVILKSPADDVMA